MANTRKFEEKPGCFTLSLDAHADLTKNLLYTVDSSTNTQTALAGAATMGPTGTTLVAAKSGQRVTLECLGLLVVTASAAISVGAPVTTAANGKVVTAVEGTDNFIGYAVTPASADGDLMTIQKIA